MITAQPVEESPTLPERPVRAPRVSIGVPVYNGGVYLREALRSLLGQTFRDLEVIVSDNASTDDTEAIVREVMAVDPRVRYSRETVNRGLIWNHRRTLELARGEYFMYAPHDDLFAPEYVERCVEVLDHDPSVAYVHAETVLVDEHGTEIGTERARQRLDDPSPSTRFWDVLIVQGGINWYGMSRRALLRSIGTYQPLPRAERVVLAELALHGPFRLLEPGLYHRRVHPGQITALRPRRRDELRVLDPTRAEGLAGATPMILARYVLLYVQAVGRARIGAREKIRAVGRLLRWIVAHLPPFRLRDPRASSIAIERTGPGSLPVGRSGVGY